MGDGTAISWTEATWSPVTGCSKVSPGCARCYAEVLACGRLKGTAGYPGLPWTPENAVTNVVLHPERLDQPLRWRKPKMIFVCSMGDLFHEQVPDEFICRVFDVMRASCAGIGIGAGHTFQVLTKRPERMRDVCRRMRFSGKGDGRVWLVDQPSDLEGYALMGGLPGCSPLPNVWLGTSIENRRYVGRAEILHEIPAAVRFISAEPLIGPLIAPMWKGNEPLWDAGKRGPQLNLAGVDWLIIGGESGQGYRPMKNEWVHDLREACRETGTAFFFKQDCGLRSGKRGRFTDEVQWPQEMPKVTTRE